MIKLIQKLKNFKVPAWPQLQVKGGTECPYDGPFWTFGYSTEECSEVFVVSGDSRGPGSLTEEGTINGKYRKQEEEYLGRAVYKRDQEPRIYVRTVSNGLNWQFSPHETGTTVRLIPCDFH